MAVHADVVDSDMAAHADVADDVDRVDVADLMTWQRLMLWEMTWMLTWC